MGSFIIGCKYRGSTKTFLLNTCAAIPIFQTTGGHYQHNQCIINPNPAVTSRKLSRYVVGQRCDTPTDLCSGNVA